MKRWVVVVAALSVLLLVAACAGNDLDMANLPQDLTTEQVKSLYDDGSIYIIDVREQDEYDAGHIPGITLLPLGQIPARMSEVPKDQTVVVVCRSGNRSNQATTYLREQGFDNVHNMQGGMIDWESSGYPVEK